MKLSKLLLTMYKYGIERTAYRELRSHEIPLLRGYPAYAPNAIIFITSCMNVDYAYAA